MNTNIKQLPLGPRSRAAAARDGSILDQILAGYPNAGLLPNERIEVLSAAQAIRIQIANHPMNGRHYDDTMINEAVADAIFDELQPLLGRHPGGKRGFEYNPNLTQAWSPDFYEPKDPASLPPRACFYAGHYYPRELVATVAPGGRGKSLMSHAESLAMITGKPLLGELPSRPLRVLMMNYEDHQDELERRFEGARKHYGISKDDVRGRIIISSVKADEMCFAKEEGEGVQIAEDVVERLRETIKRHKIDVVIIDPWVSAHSVGHNDVHKVQPIVTMFKDLAEDEGCCIELVVHPRKVPGEKDLDEQDMLGSVGLPNKTRDVRVLNAMTAAEASKYGIEPWAVADYLRLDNTKHTRRRSVAPVWRRKISVNLGNGSGPLDRRTEVGVVTPWSPPTAESLAADLAPEQTDAIKAGIAGGFDREDQRADKWAGKAVAQALGLDLSTAAGKAKAKSTLAGLIKSAALKQETREDDQRRPRKHIPVA
jgi:hypothetical protein